MRLSKQELRRYVREHSEDTGESVETVAECLGLDVKTVQEILEEEAGR